MIVTIQEIIHFPLYLSAILLSCLYSCTATSVTQNAVRSVDLDTLAQTAEAEYSAAPRTWASVRQAFDLMSQVVNGIANNHPRYYDFASRAARFAIWLSYHAEDKKTVTEFANKAIAYANKAVMLDKNRAEAYYYRASATGLFAQQHKVQSKDAMKMIRNDALKAVSIEPDLDRGGPHRLLGALYLRAPGPPAGIGSIRRALQHLQEAYRLFPQDPENLLFLAEAYIELDQKNQAKGLLEQVLSSTAIGSDLMDRQEFGQRVAELRQLLE